MNRATKKILLNHFDEIFIFFYFQDFFAKIKDFKNIITFSKKIFYRKKIFLIKKNKEKMYLKNKYYRIWNKKDIYRIIGNSAIC